MQFIYLFVLWIVLAVFCVFLFINYILSKDIISSFFFLFVTLFCIYRAFFRHKILSSRYFDVLASNQGTNEWERVIQFADDITIIDGNITTQYKWNQIIKIIDNKEYLILVFDKGSGIRVAKDGFTIGDSDTFMEYIKNEHRDIKVIIKRR